MAYEKGYVNGTSGNISLRQGDVIHISATNSRLGEISPQNLIPLSEDGSFSPSVVIPSKESLLHLYVYRSRPDINVLFHLHPVDCIAATLLLQPGNSLPIFSNTHKKKLGPVSHVDYYPAGSPELALAVSSALTNYAVLMYRHGIIVGGVNAEDAFTRCEYLVEACQLYLRLLESNRLTEDQLLKLSL
jgi:L-fuculose-phosphate aldolase